MGMTKYGLFSDPPYNSIGDPYDKKKLPKDAPGHSRNYGLSMKAWQDKSGKTNDAMFDKIRPLYEKEAFDDQVKQRRARTAEHRKRQVSDKPFVPSNPMKESAGKGDYHGTLGPKFRNMGQGGQKPKQKGDFPVGMPNIITNPLKKGSYGTIKTTLGEKQGVAGVTGEYSYASDPYDAAKKKAYEEWKLSVKNRASDNPWRPANPGKRGHYGTPSTTLGGGKFKSKGVCGEYGYQEQGPRIPAAKGEAREPFYPSKPPKKGQAATLQKYPAYIADPETEKIKKAKDAKMAEMKRLGAQEPFFPAHVPRSYATASVLKMNVNKAYRPSTR